jgi:ABC-type branched-subunit amino acid transport system substrate-binding protein
MMILGISVLSKIVLIFSYLLVSICFAEQRPSTDKIKLGMSNALTGPASQLGQELSKGAFVYFNQLNKLGGIKGQQIDLISLDDGYEPENTVRNTKTLVEQKQVLALINYVGTPTSHAILPILKQTNIPYLMPFTGADFLRTPVVENIFNLRASYLQEAKAQINFLVNKKKFSQIALVIQADEFGLAAQRSFVQTLKEHNLKPVINERFKRNSNDIEKVLIHLKAKPLEAIIFVGTYQPFSHLINLSYEQGLRPFFSTLSFASSKDVFARLSYPSKVLVSEVMPEPDQCLWDICQQFIQDMTKAGFQQLNRLQLEGYLNAYIFSLVAKQCSHILTRSCLMKKFESFKLKQGGLNISFSSNDHQGLSQVYLSFSAAAKDEQLP